MLALLKSFGRASLIAYGTWAVLSLGLAAACFVSFWQVERAQSQALLARADEGAGAAEQAMLRVFETLQSARALAQIRLQLVDSGDVSGLATIDQQLASMAAARRFGILSMQITRRGWADWSSGPPPRLARAAATASSSDGAVALDPPVPGAVPGSWFIQAGMGLNDAAGHEAGRFVVWIDALAWSRLIAPDGAGPGAISTVRLRADGALLAISRDPAHALAEAASSSDPVFQRAMRAQPGPVAITHATSLWLVGTRAPVGLPVVVTYRLDRGLALAGLYRLHATLAAVLCGLIVASFFGTRLILANYLLRRRLSEQAMLDPLTGLANRRFFTDVMTRRFIAARRAGLSCAVLLIDLDGFKQVNDSRGHAVGDALLRQVADRLRRCTGEDDVLMRLGGDEFAIVRLCHQQRRDATALARYIVSALAKVYEVDGFHLRISASVGTALYPTGGEDLNELLRSADLALYFVKSDGGDAYRIFDPAMEEAVRTKRALETDLRDALVRHQLEVYYQPLVSLDPRRVSGFEALVRWHHPMLGMIMPSRFIAIAEETGMIAQIGEWVLRQACQEATNWPPNTRIAVNLSPVQFERSDIVDIVTTVLRETRLAPGRLELEITEGVVMRDVGDVLATMQRLQGLGVRLALDDFGTGYASLSYLRSFPFDKVKIDASFLADLSGDGGTIIRAVLGLCGHLRLDTLVEGVETEEQLNWLRAEGCTEVQGHLFSPPRPAGSIMDIIAAVAARIPANLPRSLRVAAEEGLGRLLPDEPPPPASPRPTSVDIARERAIFDLASTISRPFQP